MNYMVKIDEHEYTTTNVDFILGLMRTGRTAAIGITMNLARLDGVSVHIGAGQHVRIPTAMLGCFKAN